MKVKILKRRKTMYLNYENQICPYSSIIIGDALTILKQIVGFKRLAKYNT